MTKPVGFSQQFLGRESEQRRVSDSDTVGTSTDDSVEFGANEWLVDELWGLYQKDPHLVEETWWPLFESRATESGVSVTPAPTPATAPAPAFSDDQAPITAPVAKTTSIAPKVQPIPAEAPTLATTSIPVIDTADAAEATDTVAPLKGMAKALAANMEGIDELLNSGGLVDVVCGVFGDVFCPVDGHIRNPQRGENFLVEPVATNQEFVHLLQVFP